jgi:hypothetical protein
VEEIARHSGVDVRDGVKKGNGSDRRLLWRPGGAGEEEKGQGGPGVWCHVEGKIGKRGGGQRGIARWLTTAPDRQARAVRLWRDGGRWRGAVTRRVRS